MLSHLAINETSWNWVRNGLALVVRNGTGVASKLPDFDVAGKTGTAQASKGKEHAWFVAYAPVEHPTVACSIVIEHGGHGGSAAAPIAHDLLALALGSKEAQVDTGEKNVDSD